MLRGVVVRLVVDDDDLQVRVGLRQHALDRLAEVVRLPVAGDHDRDQLGEGGRAVAPPAMAAADRGQAGPALALEHDRDLELELGRRADQVERRAEPGPRRLGQLGEGLGQVGALGPQRRPPERLAVDRELDRDGVRLRPQRPAEDVDRVGVEDRPGARLVDEAAAQLRRQRLGQRHIHDFDQCPHCLSHSSVSIVGTRRGIYLDLPDPAPLVAPAGIAAAGEQGRQLAVALERDLGGARDDAEAVAGRQRRSAGLCARRSAAPRLDRARLADE